MRGMDQDLESVTRVSIQQEVLQASQDQDHELVCAFCGIRGHRQRDCFNKEKAIRESNLLSTDQSARCTGCDTIGHSIAVCRVIRRNTPNNNDNRNREPRNNDNRDNRNRNNDQRSNRSQNENNRRNQNDFQDTPNTIPREQSSIPNNISTHPLLESLLSTLQSQNTYQQNPTQNHSQPRNRSRYQNQNQNSNYQQTSY